MTTMLVAAPRATAQQGVALGGGGARGLAHAGALLGLEERGYDPDIVVGTSMGAIIGAMYAAGYSPEEIWELVRQVDWPDLFSEYPRIQGPDRRVRFPMLELDTRTPGPRRVSGLVTDWRINRLLAQFLFDPGVRAGGDFDRLPRRYRSIAADVETGEALAIGSGNLARAVRASMAVPGVFSPVAMGNRLLVDGGIADYLPVVPARQLGADYVVAVDVIRPPAALEESDPVGLALRSFRLILRNALPAGSEPDLLLIPEIGTGVSEAGFPADPLPLLEAGLEAGLAAPEATTVARGATEPRSPPVRWDELRVESPDPGLADLVRRTFARVAPGPYEPEAVFRAMDRLFATGLFDGLWPDAAPGSDPPGSTGTALVVQVEPAPASSVAGAAGYDTDREWRLWLTARSRSGPDLLELELSGSADAIEQWATIGASLPSLSLAPLRWVADAFVRNTVIGYYGVDPFDDEPDVLRLGGWLGLELPGIAPDRYVSLTGTLESVRQSGEEPDFVFGPSLRAGVFTSASYVVGGPIEIHADARFGDFSYRRLRVRGSVPLARGAFLAAIVGDAATVGGTAPLDVLPALGDDWTFPGFRWGEFRSRGYASTGVDLAVRGPLGAYPRLRLRGAATGREVGDVTISNGWIAGAEVAAVWATPIGGAAAAFGINTRGDTVFRIDVGAAF
ncbi:MAG TPA: patatin-like phospholipase family protein [Longimicrobiales bacterium]|nr:patatin-like phospholipase family protein [Longimicrobiales bacterium]